MKRRLAIAILSFIHNGHCLSLDLEKSKQDLKEHQSFLTRPIEKQLQKREAELQKALNLLQQSNGYKNIVKQYNTVISMPEWKQLTTIYKCKNTLLALIQYHENLIDHQLLEEVSTLIEDRFCPKKARVFLQKERARLMDTADEAILLNTLQRQIQTLAQGLEPEIKTLQDKLKNSQEYKQFKTNHELFLKTKESKACIILFQKILSLVHEKIALLLKDREYQNTLIKIQKAASMDSFIKSLILEEYQNKILTILNQQYNLLLTETDLYIL